jgi:hypothetical protein
VSVCLSRVIQVAGVQAFRFYRHAGRYTMNDDTLFLESRECRVRWRIAVAITGLVSGLPLGCDDAQPVRVSANAPVYTWPPNGPHEEAGNWQDYPSRSSAQATIAVPRTQVRLVEEEILEAIARLQEKEAVAVDPNRIVRYGVQSPKRRYGVRPFLIRGLCKRDGSTIVNVELTLTGNVLVVSSGMKAEDEKPIKAPFIVWLAEEPRAVENICVYECERGG